MTVDKSWQLGGTSNPVYRLYDGLRRRLNRRLVDYVCDHALPEHGGIVLEAGSGTAFASSLMCEKPSISAIALDYDLEALMEAQRRDPSLPVVVGDLRRLPFRDDAVDVAWNSSTLEHLPSMDEALTELHRITKRGGRVFVGVPYVYGPLGFQRWIANTGAGAWIGTVYSEAGLRGKLAKAGFVPLNKLRYFFRFFIGIVAEKPDHE
jgi:SAM-dependent methyltransferase